MTRERKVKAYKKGYFAEFLARLVLRLKGYSIVSCRYKTTVGEIDIIARRGAVTIFCEVKARKDYETAVHSISREQQQRIVRTAELYLARIDSSHKNNKIETNIYRYDMILVLPWRWPIHIENAW